MNFLANSARVNPVAFRTLAKLHVVGQRFSPKRLMRLLLLNVVASNPASFANPEHDKCSINPHTRGKEITMNDFGDFIQQYYHQQTCNQPSQETLKNNLGRFRNLDKLMDTITKFVSREELQREQVVGMEIKPVR